jgi:hypothetical protein
VSVRDRPLVAVLRRQVADVDGELRAQVPSGLDAGTPSQALTAAGYSSSLSHANLTMLLTCNSNSDMLHPDPAWDTVDGNPVNPVGLPHIRTMLK